MFPPPIFVSKKKQEKPNISLKLPLAFIKLLTTLKPMLKGKKTYITGTLAILTAIAMYLTGDANIADTAQTIITSILGMTVRNAVATK